MNKINEKVLDLSKQKNTSNKGLSKMNQRLNRLNENLRKLYIHIWMWEFYYGTLSLLKWSPQTLFAPCTIWDPYGINMRTNTGQIHDEYRTNTGQIQDKYRTNIGPIQDKYRTNTGQIQVKYTTNTGQI